MVFGFQEASTRGVASRKEQLSLLHLKNRASTKTTATVWPLRDVHARFIVDTFSPGEGKDTPRNGERTTRLPNPFRAAALQISGRNAASYVQHIAYWGYFQLERSLASHCCALL